MIVNDFSFIPLNYKKAYNNYGMCMNCDPSSQKYLGLLEKLKIAFTNKEFSSKIDFICEYNEQSDETGLALAFSK